MININKFTPVFVTLFLVISVTGWFRWVFDGTAASHDVGSDFTGRDATQIETRSKQTENTDNKERKKIPTRSGGSRKLGNKTDLQAEAQKDVKMILDGISILEYLPDYSGLEAMFFLEELEKALKADLSSSGDFGKIEKIFNDLDRGGKKFGGIKIPLLRFIPQLESGAGVSGDVTKKISLYEILNRSDFVMSFSNYLAAVGAEKALGPIGGDVISAIPDADRKSLLWGMARSGDMDAITTVLGIQEEAERGSLLKYTVKELMGSHPGKTISYIDEMQDPVQREFCLTFAVEALRLAGATVEAEEWTKQLRRASEKN